MGYTYKNIDWLKQKYFEENLSLKEIGVLCNTSAATIAYQFKKHNITVYWSGGSSLPDPESTQIDLTPKSK